VRLLLDTHVLLWLMAGSRRLDSAVRSRMQQAEAVYASSVSIWEIAIKRQIGKIQEDPEIVVNELETAGIRELQVSNLHAVAVGRLPLLHRDPFDRLLIAQAISEPMQFMTGDAKLREYTELAIVI
jgi:PIN domain nuclease of toxin-antitoxin system